MLFRQAQRIAVEALAYLPLLACGGGDPHSTRSLFKNYITIRRRGVLTDCRVRMRYRKAPSTLTHLWLGHPDPRKAVLIVGKRKSQLVQRYPPAQIRAEIRSAL